MNNKKKNKKRIILIPVLLCIFVIAGVLAVTLIPGLKLRFVRAYQKMRIPGIVCIGDSLTHGTGEEGTDYPSVLKNQLESHEIYIPVVNMGVGGENTVTIGGRMGGIPFKLNEFTIPSGIEETPISFIDSKDKEVTPLIAGFDRGMNPCKVMGVEGNITIDEDRNYYFTRKKEGRETPVPKETEVETFAGKEYRDYIFVLFMGENGGYRDTEELIRQQQMIIDKQRKNKDKFIIIGLTTGSEESRKEQDSAMQEKWGEHYLNIRKYLCEYALDECLENLSEKDVEKCKKGTVPKYLRIDDIHYNDLGYRILAEAVYEKLEKLGYIETN